MVGRIMSPGTACAPPLRGSACLRGRHELTVIVALPYVRLLRHVIRIDGSIPSASNRTPTPTAWSWRRSAGIRCVVGKESYADGDLAAYIPEGAICPEWLIAELGLEGKLAGSKKNRVKAVQLRGSLSQGLVYPGPRRDDPRAGR